MRRIAPETIYIERFPAKEFSMEISEIIARVEIADVLHTYAHGADRCDWALVRSCYRPDAYDDHGLYAGGLDGLMVSLDSSGRS